MRRSRFIANRAAVSKLSLLFVPALLLAMLVPAAPARAAETFGVESFASSIVSNAGGASATQAGSHPYALTTSIVFNHVVTVIEETSLRASARTAIRRTSK